MSVITRREFMRGALGCALAFAAPGLVTRPGAPDEIVWARTWFSGAEGSLAQLSPAMLVRMFTFERDALEADASARYGRPIQFEVIDEGGQRFRRDPGDERYYLLWRERLDLHPYWSTQL